MREILPELLKHYQVAHICGKGKTDNQYDQLSGYKQFEYLNEEYADLLACADLVISRAGANSLYELLSLKKPHILIPLPLSVSRGDQIHNANHFSELGLSEVIIQEKLTGNLLLDKVNDLYANKTDYLRKLNALSLPNSIKLICNVINEI